MSERALTSAELRDAFAALTDILVTSIGTRIEAQIGGLSKSMSELSAKVKVLATDVSAVRADLAEVQADVATLLSKRLDKLEERLDALEQAPKASKTESTGGRSFTDADMAGLREMVREVVAEVLLVALPAPNPQQSL